MDEISHFKTSVNILYSNCFQCKLHYGVWRDLDQSLSGKEKLYSKFNLFWATTLKAQLEAAQLHLLKLFDNQKRSLNILKLVEYAEKNKNKLFKSEALPMLEYEISCFRKEINDYGDEIKSLQNIRNDHFVHLSKEYSKNYDKLYRDYPKLREDIIEILLICADILNVFKDLIWDEGDVMVTGEEYQTKELVQFLSTSVEK